MCTSVCQSCWCSHCFRSGSRWRRMCCGGMMKLFGSFLRSSARFCERGAAWMDQLWECMTSLSGLWRAAPRISPRASPGRTWGRTRCASAPKPTSRGCPGASFYFSRLVFESRFACAWLVPLCHARCVLGVSIDSASAFGEACPSRAEVFPWDFPPLPQSHTSPTLWSCFSSRLPCHNPSQRRRFSLAYASLSKFCYRSASGGNSW